MLEDDDSRLLLEEEARMLLVLVWGVDVLVRDFWMEEGAKAWAAPMRKRREMIRLIMVIVVMGALIDYLEICVCAAKLRENECLYMV